MPCAVKVAWVVARETRAEDNPTHFRQDSATAGWQHRQSICNVEHVGNTLPEKFDIILPPKREKKKWEKSLIKSTAGLVFYV